LQAALVVPKEKGQSSQSGIGITKKTITPHFVSTSSEGLSLEMSQRQQKASY
jgi:hypothetical protein